MTVGEALNTPTTALGAARLAHRAAHAERVAAAEAVAVAERITLEEALNRVWSVKA